MRVLIALYGWNQRKHLEALLDQIPSSLRERYSIEVLVIDARTDRFPKRAGVIFLNTRVELQYGAQVKLAFAYAIDQGFDRIVTIAVGENYPLARLGEILAASPHDLAIGSWLSRSPWTWRFAITFIPVLILNAILNTSVRAVLSGYRSYAVTLLKKIPFERNSDGREFETETLIQALKIKARVTEVPIPKHTTQVSIREGAKTVLGSLRSALLSRTHDWSILYQPQFDLHVDNSHYSLKLGYRSSHSMALDAVRPGSQVIDIGCNQGQIAQELKKKKCSVVGADFWPLLFPERMDRFIQIDLNDFSKIPHLGGFDHVLLLDVIEHVDEPEKLLDQLREKASIRPPRLVISTGNIAFIIIRLQLLFGQFNFGKQGILDMTHKRLFTFRSLERILRQSGYDILSVRGVPAPFPKAIGLNPLSQGLLLINQALIALSKTLFSYQIFIEAAPRPSTRALLEAMNAPSPSEYGG